MTDHYGLEGLRTLDLNLRIEKTNEALELEISLIQANNLIIKNQVIIMQALVDIINEMQKSKD